MFLRITATLLLRDVPRVNPEILRWARESAGLGLDEAARKLGVNDVRGMVAAARLLALETGEAEPTRPLLLRMSKHYRRPLVTFYLPAPPRKGTRGQDFRTLPANERTEDEAVLDVLLRDIIARQSLLRAALEDEDEPAPLDFVASSSVDDGVQVLVQRMKDKLDVTVERYRSQRTAEDAFRLLREAAERIGIFVLLVSDLGSHHTSLDIETFRGFALSDPIAPFVVINDKDSKAAWSFTLLHELVHLWLGYTGVSGVDVTRDIERFCNEVAAEFLLPRGEIREFPVDRSMSMAELGERIAQFANSRKVSRSMIALGLFLNGKISREQWGQLAARFRQEWREHRESARLKDTGGGPDYYVVRRQRLGDALVSTTARLLATGALTTTKAGRVLGVKPYQVQRLTTLQRAR